MRKTIKGFPVGRINEKKAFKKDSKMNKKKGKTKRLYRSGKEKIFGGVCGGIAEYLNIDPTIVRLVLIALTLALLPVGAIGVIFYIIAWIIMPRNPTHEWN